LTVWCPFFLIFRTRRPERVASFVDSYGGEPAASLRALLDDASIDAVYIATLPDSHAAFSIAALQAGKAVLCEKPSAISSAELESILQVAAMVSMQQGHMCAIFSHICAGAGGRAVDGGHETAILSAAPAVTRAAAERSDRHCTVRSCRLLTHECRPCAPLVQSGERRRRSYGDRRVWCVVVD
jgi:hypothetical protein